MEDVAADVLDALDRLINAAVRAVRKGDDPGRAVEARSADLDDLYEAIYVAVFPAFAEARFEEVTAKSFTKGDAPGLLEKWLAAARKFVQSRPIEKRIKKVLQTTVDWVNTITDEALAEGLSTDQAASRIVDGWSDPESGISRGRAERIARTETLSASNAGGHQGALDSGVDMKKFWISTLDGRVRDAHDTGQNPSLAVPIKLDGFFIVDGEQLSYPGDPSGSAGNVINCRCVEGYDVAQ